MSPHTIATLIIILSSALLGALAVSVLVEPPKIKVRSGLIAGEHAGWLRLWLSWEPWNFPVAFRALKLTWIPSRGRAGRMTFIVPFKEPQTQPFTQEFPLPAEIRERLESRLSAGTLEFEWITVEGTSITERLPLTRVRVAYQEQGSRPGRPRSASQPTPRTYELPPEVLAALLAPPQIVEVAPPQIVEEPAPPEDKAPKAAESTQKSEPEPKPAPPILVSPEPPKIEEPAIPKPAPKSVETQAPAKPKPPARQLLSQKEAKPSDAELKARAALEAIRSLASTQTTEGSAPKSVRELVSAANAKRRAERRNLESPNSPSPDNA